MQGFSANSPQAQRCRQQHQHAPVSGEGFVRPVLVLDALLLGCRWLADALLGHPDGYCQRRVDAGVARKLSREAVTAGGAALLALGHPALEAGKAEVVLAGGLQQEQ